MLAVKRTMTVLVFIALTGAICTLGQSAPPWKVFANRAGWSISYPADWHIASCRSCNDPKAADVFVDFFPPRKRTADGWVMVSRLANKPADTSVDAWLVQVSATANVNKRIHDEPLQVDGLPAIKVRYRQPEGETEEVYVVSGSNTFSVSFSADPGSAGTSLESLHNYATYVRMLQSFRVKAR